jgi:lipid-A-disaccharide synthase
VKYYILSGEASGDLHASNLVKALRRVDEHALFRAWGGDHLQEVGVTPVKHIRDLAFMGFVEVVANLPAILRNLDFCKKDILHFKPDLLILVDYPGFNMRMAEWAKKRGIKTAYYITPQVWAWKQKRAYKLGRISDLILTILPFEKEFFKKFTVEAHYVGHPLLDALANFPTQNPEAGRVAILPGSRKMEIRNMLPVMLEAADSFPNYRFVIAGAPSVDKAYYESFLQGRNIPVVFGHTYTIIAESQAAWVTSGTATLETALLGTPQVVCYRGNPISYQIVKQWIRVPYISLVNLILNRPLVSEFIQHDLNPENLRLELTRLMQDEAYSGKIKNGYLELKEKLGGEGASMRAAELILATLKNKK